MIKRRVFLSFLAEDEMQVNGLRLLAANPNYPLEFFDESVRVPYDSVDADYIRRRIREKISRTSVTVCLVGPQTHTSRWVEWELEESIEKGNTIFAMALKGVDSAILPNAIKSRNLPFYPWDPQLLARLIAG